MTSSARKQSHATPTPVPLPRRQWRDYRTLAGGRPIKDFIDTLTDDEAAEVVAAMREVAEVGLAVAKHLRGDIYEVRADAATRSFRILFSAEGRFSQVLLSLVAFAKKTQKTPWAELELATQRLRDWRTRGEERRRTENSPSRVRS